jgi:hypothetical protein
MMSFLAQRWVELTEPQKATWETLAAATGIPPYNAFLSTNLERWGQFKAPGIIYPVAEDGTQPVATFTLAFGLPGSARLSFTITTLNNVWGLVIFRSQTTPLVPSRENTIAIVHRQTTGLYSHLDTGLDPGTYYYQARFFTIHGATGPNETQRTANVT